MPQATLRAFDGVGSGGGGDGRGAGTVGVDTAHGFASGVSSADPSGVRPAHQQNSYSPAHVGPEGPVGGGGAGANSIGDGISDGLWAREAALRDGFLRQVGQRGFFLVLRREGRGVYL